MKPLFQKQIVRKKPQKFMITFTFIQNITEVSFSSRTGEMANYGCLLKIKKKLHFPCGLYIYLNFQKMPEEGRRCCT